LQTLHLKYQQDCDRPKLPTRSRPPPPTSPSAVSSMAPWAVSAWPTVLRQSTPLFRPTADKYSFHARPSGTAHMRTPSRMTPSLPITFHIVYDRNEKPGSFCNLLGFDNTPFCAHLTTSASSPHLVTIVTDNTGCEVQHGMTSSHDWWAPSQRSEITWAASNVVTTFEAAHQSPPSFKSARTSPKFPHILHHNLPLAPHSYKHDPHSHRAGSPTQHAREQAVPQRKVPDAR